MSKVSEDIYWPAQWLIGELEQYATNKVEVDCLDYLLGLKADK